MEIQTENQKLTPTVRWHQTKEYVILYFEVNKAKVNNIKIDDSYIYFSVMNDNYYEMNFELFNNIDKNQSKYIIEEKHIKIFLKKIDQESWNYLTKDKNIYKNNIKINWNEWNNDDEEEENDIQNNMPYDFEKMMQNMGGLEGMNNEELDACDNEQCNTDNYDENNDSE